MMLVISYCHHDFVGVACASFAAAAADGDDDDDDVIFFVYFRGSAASPPPPFPPPHRTQLVCMYCMMRWFSVDGICMLRTGSAC